MKESFHADNKSTTFITGGLLLLGLYLSSFYSYLLFHSLAEIFSIVIAFSIFVLAWNCRNIIDNNYLIFLGIAYLFIGFIDTLHTLAYAGMGVFPGYGANLPTQLWIAARYLESISLFIAYFILEKKKVKINFILLGYTIILSVLLLSIFYWKRFPACFIEGTGLTPFKKISEYIISLILVASLFLLLRKKEKFDPQVLRWLAISILLTIVSELAFTFYISVYGLSNLVGHIFKIISFYFVYQAIVVTGLTRPNEILYRSLQESESRFRELFNHISSGVAVYEVKNEGQDFIFKDINQIAEKIDKIKKEDIIGKSILKIFPGVKDFGLFKVFQEVYKTGEPQHYPLALYQDQRISGWRENYIYKLPSGEIVAIYNDITEHKQSEENLRMMAEILDTAPSAIFIHDFNGRFLYANRKSSELHGYEADEFMSLNLHELDVPESEALIAERMQLIKEKGAASFEVAHIRKDGTTFPLDMLVKLVKWHGVSAMLGINVDISRRKEAEESLRKSQQEFESLFRNSPEALVCLDEKGTFLDANLRFCQLFGYSLTEIKGRNIDEGLIHPPDKIEEGKELSIKGLTGYFNFETIRKKKDGALFPVSISATPLLIDGQFKGEIGLYIDISERIKLQNALQESEEKFYSISASALDAIFFIDHTGSITYCNQAAEKMFDYVDKEMLGKDLHQLIVPSKYHPDFKKGFSAFQETGEGPALGKTWELSALKKTGEEFPVALSLSVVKLKGKWNAVGIIRDISPQKEAEKKLEKLARTDTLTGSFSRGYGLELLDRQMKLSHRSKSPLLLAFLDIDRFKSINDTYGHDEGDLVLKELANLFKSTLREIDIICRMGGDEFLLIFPDNSLKDASQIKERLNKNLIELNQTLKKPYTLGLSIGFSEYNPNTPLAMDELIRLADQRMYEEKRKKKQKE